MKSFLNELIMIADILDSEGLHKEAEEIDLVVNAAYDSSTHRAAINFWKYFREAVVSEMQKPATFIGPEALQKLDKIADMILNSYSLTPDVSQETYNKIQPGSPYEMASGLLALESSIHEIEEDLKSEKNPDTIKNLEKELEQYRGELSKKWDILSRIESGQGRGDKDKEFVEEVYRLLEEHQGR